MNELDIPWLDSLGHQRYGNRYDRYATEGWLRNVVFKQPMLFLPIRTDNAFLIAMLACPPWTPSEFEASVILVCAKEGRMWEAFRLLRVSVEWAKRRKCTTWRICSDTEYDFTALAKRLGATEITTRFVIKL